MDYTTRYCFNSNVSRTFIREILPIMRGKKVLDIGCGQGNYLEFFGKGSLGLDLSSENLKNAKKKGLRVKQMDFNKSIKLGESFDAVFTSHVLEHVDAPVNLLRYANSCLKKNGLLVISVPNESSVIHWKYPYFTRNGNHLYSFSIENIKELLLATKFESPKICWDFHTALSRKFHIDPILDYLRVLPQFMKTPLAWAYWFIARKK